MALSCPNKSSQEWKDLVEKVGEREAYRQFVESDFQTPSTWKQTNEKGLEETINKFLDSAGITVKSVREITNRDGEVIGANAMADLVYKTIQVVDGKAKIDTLPEEASHFLVAMLRGSTLYSSMFDDIQNYDIYKDVVREYKTQYENNTTKLKEEAMAKVIGNLVVDNFEDEKLQKRASSWFNKVLNYIKNIFNRGSKQALENGIFENAPFSEAADMIINQWGSREYFPSSGDESFYQLNSQEPETIAEAIENNLNRGSISLEGQHYEVTKPDGTKIQIKNRVSDRTKSTSGREFTPQEVANNAIRAQTGTNGHADIQNIIQRSVAIDEGTIVPAKVSILGDQIYSTLETWFQNFKATFPAGTKFLTEQQVWDEKADEAGTLDLIAIKPDGVTDIYDWKFQEFKGKKDNKEIAAWKRNNWNKQIGTYANILQKVYGIKKIGRRRVIPIETTYEGNVLKGIKIGPTDIENFSSRNQHLKPVPIQSETTGDERLDRLLEDLLRQKEDLVATKPSNIEDDAKRAAFVEQKKIRIAEIDKAIQDIQLTNDIGTYVKRGIKQVRDIADVGVENLSEPELVQAKANMDFYGTHLIRILGNLVKDKTKTYQSDLKDLTANAQVYQGEITNEFIKRGKDNFGDDIDMPQEGSNFWVRSMRTLSQQNHPVMKAFYRLVQGSKQQTRKALSELTEKIEHTQSALREYQSAKGISSEHTFDFMLDKTGRTLKLLAKYSNQYYDTRNANRDLLSSGTKAEQEKALAWFRANTVFNEEAFEKAYEENKKQSEKFFKNYDNASDLVKRASKEFTNKYGDNATGYKNANNYYVKPKDDFFSDGYKEIQANKPLKDFYDLFTENTQNFRKIVGQPFNGRFVWNVKKDFVESIAENGLASTNSMSFLRDAFRLQAGEGRDGNIDPKTGEPIHALPTYFLEGVETNKQSSDLGRVLYLAGAMAYNYKHMSEIEDSSKGLEIILRNSEEILTNNNGEPITNKLTGRLQKIIGSSDTIDQYKDYMNYYIYGIKNKTKDYKINAFGQEYSALAAYQFVNKTFIGKALAANPVSIVANIVGGDWNVRIIGAGKRFFDTSHYNSALADMAIRDKKAYSLIGHFDLLHGENHFSKSSELSVNALTKHLTYEKLFIGQEAGDYAIRNGVLLAMMRSHELENGKIVKITDRKKGGLTLYDSFSIEDGKLKGLDAIPEQALEGFRTKVLKVTEDILGNNSRDDIRTAGLTVMGRALMAFRSWIPRTIDSRYGELRESEDIQGYELGRYRSFWNQIVTKQWLPLLGETIANFGTFGYTDFGNATRERAKELYREALIKNPNLKLSEDEYIDIHIQNLKANMSEIYIVTSMLALLMAVKPNPDDDKDDMYGIRKVIARQMARNMSELLFYYNPSEFNKMLKSPIPITRAFADLGNLLVDTTKEGWGAATGNQKMQDKATPIKWGLKIFPLLNGLESIGEAVNEAYDPDKTFSGNSSRR